MAAGVYQSRFASQQEAVAWLAKKLRVTPASLKRSSTPRPHLPLSLYRGVVYHGSRGTARWEGRFQNETIGTFKCQHSAARAVAKRAGVRVCKLKKKSPVTNVFAIKHFATTYKVFAKYMPGDLQSMAEHEKMSKAMFAQETMLTSIDGCGQSFQASGFVQPQFPSFHFPKSWQGDSRSFSAIAFPHRAPPLKLHVEH